MPNLCSSIINDNQKRNNSIQPLTKEDLRDKIIEKLSQMTISNSQQETEYLDSLEISHEYDTDHETVLSIYRSLNSKENYIESSILKTKTYEISPKAVDILENGDPLYKLYHKLPSNGQEISRDVFLKENTDCDFKLISESLKLKNIVLSKKDGSIFISKVPGRYEHDFLRENIQKFKLCLEQNTIATFPKDIINDFTKNKIIIEKIISKACFRPGKEFKTSMNTDKLDLTTADISNDSWMNLKFRKYNLNAMGSTVSAGDLHPLMKMKEEISSCLLQLGFNEMKTNQYVENSFWCFDTLSVPQNHPARDDQDTFFISDCNKDNFIPEDIIDKVKEMHESMFKNEWDFNQSKIKILRTHTTAVSTRTLYQKAKEYKDRFQDLQIKYFSIDKVFRNETLDSTHLAEFHQVEGWIAGKDISLAHLMGMLKQFYDLLGINKIKFKPTYNPYTEPSLEVFGYHNKLQKWIEIANSGIFRPEMCRALGLDPSISIIAWGLSLERPTMIKYGINNIRDLYGHKVDLDMIKKSKICLL